MDKVQLQYWLAVEESKTIRFSDLAHMMAKAMYPSDDELMSYGAARLNLDAELPKVVLSGKLFVRNPAGMGRLTFPIGTALQDSVLLASDLSPFLAERGIGLRLIPHGSGPQYWTIENAAAAIAAQEGWSGHQRATFQDQMVDAASNRNLTVRHPHTDLPINTGPIRTFYELVTPDDVNAWLKKQSAPYRWNAQVAAPPVSPTAAKPYKPFTHRIKNRAEAILTPEITQAKVKAPDPNSVASVWGELTKLAESGFGVMIGFSSDGIQYRGRKYQADQIPDVFTRRNLRERMTRKVVQKRAEPH